ncbi:hypothetical protein A2U01_0002901 [Trifolium medium]|uniref:Uncharacterized protein n=1 Tax=Trifolium medium TaxID=97028 RepID=A0A392M6P1_9FABA|nr:hypothetical protein [Trifolium medium]
MGNSSLNLLTKTPVLFKMVSSPSRINSDDENGRQIGRINGRRELVSWNQDGKGHEA